MTMPSQPAALSSEAGPPEAIPKPMKPVAGERAPMMYLEETGVGVPATGPVQKHSTFSGESGSVPSGTSLYSVFATKP